MILDTLINNAWIIDGTGSPARKGQVGISQDRITFIGEGLTKSSAENHVDAKGYFLCPGFIDPHASTGFGLFFPHAADHKLYQGITTEIFGNCGTSTAPVGPNLVETMDRLSNEIGFPFHWQTMAEYNREIETRGLQFNIAQMVGHSTLRGGYLADWNRLEASELEAMKAALRQALTEGALGLSTGLIYPPGCYAELEEIIELTRIVKEAGGVYASHIRNEREGLEEAVAEALTIGREAKIDILISHLKAAERPNWGKIPGIINTIKNYNRTSEYRAWIDAYPYTAISTKLRAFIPKHILQDGIENAPSKLQSDSIINEIDQYISFREYDLDSMLLISDENPIYEGKTVAQVSAMLERSPGSTVASVLAENTEMWIVYDCINREDMDAAILWENAMICTDSWSYPINAPKKIGKPHPRSYGAFTEFLENYVIRKKSLSFEAAIRKMTWLPASFFNLKQRGTIAQNHYADLLVLNPDNLEACASYQDPMQLSKGIEHLWVNGTIVIESREINDSKSGMVLRRTDHE